MSYKVKSTSVFERQAKRLSKKYTSLPADLLQLINELKKNPIMGTPVGHNCFKIRIKISSKGKGKSGGARVLTNIVVSNTTIYLLSIYDKSEKENLSDNELKDLLKDILE